MLIIEICAALVTLCFCIGEDRGVVQRVVRVLVRAHLVKVLADLLLQPRRTALLDQMLRNNQRDSLRKWTDVTRLLTAVFCGCVCTDVNNSITDIALSLLLVMLHLVVCLLSFCVTSLVCVELLSLNNSAHVMSVYVTFETLSEVKFCKSKVLAEQLSLYLSQSFT